MTNCLTCSDENTCTSCNFNLVVDTGQTPDECKACSFIFAGCNTCVDVSYGNSECTYCDSIPGGNC